MGVMDVIRQAFKFLGERYGWGHSYFEYVINSVHKAGVKKALIPMKNYERDLDDIPDEVKSHVEIIGVSRIEEVLKEIFVK